MAENTSIEWAHHTFNPWIGCQKVSEACENCYAEAWDKRGLHKQHIRWGPHARRTRTSKTTWRNPVKWHREAVASGMRPRVFCASLADVFDNHRSIQQEWRDDLWSLIRETTGLDWLLLTKRPQNIARYLPADWGAGYQNVWLGATVENQKAADRIEALTSVQAAIRFLSCEPLLGPIDLSSHLYNIDWVIAGGESGGNFRPTDPNWFRSLRDQCATTGTAFLFKQWEGGNKKTIKAKGRELDGIVHQGYPSSKLPNSLPG